MALFLMALAVSGLFAPARAAPAQAVQTGSEQITSYQIEMEVERDGDLRISETIDYDFGDRRRHGIFRYIPDRIEQDDGRMRRYDIDNIEVSSPTGAPDRADVEREDDHTFIRIGDPDLTVEGRHTYVIDYVVRNGLTAFDDHDELYWDAIGHEWQVPINSIEVEVTVPAEVTEAACFQGPTGSTENCDSATSDGGTASFTQESLDPRSGITVRVTWPKGAVTMAEPDYAAGRWGFALLSLLGLLGPLLALLIYRAVGPRKGSGRVTLGVPPEGVPAGLAGALLNGGAKSQHVVAVLVDLAARGHLRIEAAPSGNDWVLVRQGGLPPGLAPYEETLLRSLFTGRDYVWISELKHQVDGIWQVRRQIDAELVRLGWLRFSANRAMASYSLLFLSLVPALFFWDMGEVDGTGWAALGFTLTAVLAFPGIFLVSTPFTPLGWDIARQLKGMKETLRHQAPVHAPDPGQTFSSLMPYAVAFGLAGAFASQFAALGGRCRRSPGGTGPTTRCGTGTPRSTASPGAPPAPSPPRAAAGAAAGPPVAGAVAGAAAAGDRRPGMRARRSTPYSRRTQRLTSLQDHGRESRHPESSMCHAAIRRSL